METMGARLAEAEYRNRLNNRVAVAVALISAFMAVTKIAPEDGPVKFYLKQIAEFRQHPPLQVDWGGEIELKEK